MEKDNAELAKVYHIISNKHFMTIWKKISYYYGNSSTIMEIHLSWFLDLHWFITTPTIRKIWNLYTKNMKTERLRMLVDRSIKHSICENGAVKVFPIVKLG